MDPTSGAGGAQSAATGRGSGPPQPARRPTEITALLGRGTHFEGKLHFDGRVRIDGAFKGDIRGEDVLIIGEGADIEGTIEVGTCIVTAGEVRADIRARDAIELYPPAKVTGALHSPAIFIDRGVQFEGTCTMAPLQRVEGAAPLREEAADDESDSELGDEPTLGAEDAALEIAAPPPALEKEPRPSARRRPPAGDDDT
jgi:cytoskeletal protein CcmA (bactofilin family)